MKIIGHNLEKVSLNIMSAEDQKKVYKMLEEKQPQLEQWFAELNIHDRNMRVLCEMDEFLDKEGSDEKEQNPLTRSDNSQEIPKETS